MGKQSSPSLRDVCAAVATQRCSEQASPLLAWIPALVKQPQRHSAVLGGVALALTYRSQRMLLPLQYPSLSANLSRQARGC